jgi:hypothetical protein
MYDNFRIRVAAGELLAVIGLFWLRNSLVFLLEWA